ncbi:MAG: tyrosine-type recombinase/integrase [Bacteroidales bacterium]|nr:tyrosine-type recombinase/integrase [Bacteroidales bacterium]
MEFNITFAQAKTHVDDFVSFMQSLGYKKSTQKIVKQNVKLFLNSEEDSKQFTEDSLYEFILNRYDQTLQATRFNSVLGSCRRFFSYVYRGDFSIARPAPEPLYLTEPFKLSLDSFLSEQSIRNAKCTLLKKQKAIVNLFMYLMEHNIYSLDELSSKIILDYLQEKIPETKAYIRSYLRYLFSQHLLVKDYSVLIITTKRPRKLPTVYTKEEIRTIVNVVNGNSLIEKRNKAIILIIATTGMRSCDIVRLKYSDFCFEKKRIEITQVKTGVPLSLPLDEETTSAVMDYYANRPDSQFENLFINQNAPFNPISTGIIRYILRKAFVAAHIDVTGKKHGPHSLRSSLASAMVNSDIPYEIVQNQLGHTSDNSLRSYVRFDIEKLRVCALESQPPTGNFKRWMEGGV